MNRIRVWGTGQERESRVSILVHSGVVAVESQAEFWHVACIWDEASGELEGTAALLNDQFAVTAAHVLTKFLERPGSSRPMLASGIIDFEDAPGSSQAIPLRNIFLPDQPYFGRAESDIALIRIERPPFYQDEIFPDKPYPILGTEADLVEAMRSSELLRICGFGAEAPLPIGYGSVPEAKAMKRAGEGVTLKRLDIGDVQDPEANFLIVDDPILPGEVMAGTGDSGCPALLLQEGSIVPILLGINQCLSSNARAGTLFLSLCHPQIRDWVSYTMRAQS